MGKNEQESTASMLREVSSASSKHQPIWTIPGKAYAEVWKDSKGMHWFAVTGCWRTPKTAKTDAELDAERMVDDENVVAHLLAATYKAWTPAQRRERMIVIRDPKIRTEDMLRLLGPFGVKSGRHVDKWAAIADVQARDRGDSG
jgi:hypothetical protein